MPDNVTFTTKLGGALVGGDTSNGWDGVRAKLHDLFLSLVRTVVPIIAGYVASTLARRGLKINEAEVGLWLTPVLQGAWYSVPRLLEPRFPWMGWFLGLAKQPAYSPEAGQQVAPIVVEVPPPDPGPEVAIAVPPAVEDEARAAVEAVEDAMADEAEWDGHQFKPHREDRCTVRDCGLTPRAKVHQRAA